jgi:hypothetical protein
VLVGVVAGMVLGDGRVKADFIFGEPIQLGEPIWSSGHDPQGCCFSGDGLELYFSSTRSGGQGGRDIWVATREALGAPWGDPVNLGSPVNDSGNQIEPAISPDGLELYFGDLSDWNIRVCKRPSKDAPWSSQELLGPPVGLGNEAQMEFSADGLSLYFRSRRSGGYGESDIWVSTRATTSDLWGEPTNLGPNVNTSSSEGYPSISSDGRVLFFNSDRSGCYNPDGYEIWMTTRATINDPWRPPVNCDIINDPAKLSGDFKIDPAISPDGSVLYFERSRDMWQSTINPIVDFNGDGIVDSADMCIIIDHWCTDNSLCDIGPMPWGDGIVDVQDLIVLAEHLDDRLVANWAMDEIDGDIAYDSTGGNHGTLYGNPTWQPNGGKYAGALEFDGIDDYVSMPYVLNPAIGSFSSFAWMKGGAPGDVIITQAGNNGGTWLGINPSDGSLMTGLGDTYFGVLESESIITDDQWHHIGLVYDFGALHRILYVDGAQVAEDATFVAPQPASGGLHLGASKDLDADSFFSGLIDDVRIYNFVVNP